jgi:CMP-N-acetylneuraminic acid synthetase
MRLVLDHQVSSGMTIRASDYPPHWMFWRDSDGKLSRLYAEGRSIKRRQDAPVAWQPNGLVYIVGRQWLTEDLSLPLRDTVGLPMEWEDSVNIDTPWQFRLAEIIWADRHKDA